MAEATALSNLLISNSQPVIIHHHQQLMNQNLLQPNSTNITVSGDLTHNTVKSTPSNSIDCSAIVGDRDSSPQPSNKKTSEPIFEFGPYIPIIRRESDILIDPKGVVSYFNESGSNSSSKRHNWDVHPDDAILDAPSMITPLLLKKKTKWPSKEVTKDLAHQNNQVEPNQTDSKDADTSDDIQIVKIVNNAEEKVHEETNSRSVEDYVKATTVASLTHIKSISNNTILTIKDYYKSSVGDLLIGIGLGRVREFNLGENVRRFKSKIKKGDTSLIKELEASQEQLLQAKASSQIYKSNKLLRCPHCPFKSEFSIVMSGHMEIPHLSNKREYMCNWCDYKVKDCNQIVFHNLVEHKKRCRIEKPPSVHLCRYCPYECKSKRKMVSHSNRCELSFKPERNLEPAEYGENEFPAVTTKLISKQDVKTYEHTLKSLRLAAYNPHQLKVSSIQPPGRPALLVPRQNYPLPATASAFSTLDTATNQNVLNVTSPSNSYSTTSVSVVGNNQASISNLIQNQHTSAQLLHLLSTQNTYSGQSRIGILQHPRTQSPFANGKTVMKTASEFVMPPSANSVNFINGTPANNTEKDLMRERQAQDSLDNEVVTINPSPNPKGSTFVICEICDGYIKDLSQLKSHMQWIHKVKIHQKMLISRPPLNCQKCQWRFFTDQGLERHLLGAHGLVTSNMQELVDQGADSGRCTVCGRAYANKLVAHMREVHKSNLKPAHLSYKCTVCSATFNLYRLFENHVYSVHSESVKRVSSN